MLEKLNNYWVLILSFLIFCMIIKKLYYLNKPFDEQKFIQQYNNQTKLKDKIGINYLLTNQKEIMNYMLFK